MEKSAIGQNRRETKKELSDSSRLQISLQTFLYAAFEKARSHQGDERRLHSPVRPVPGLFLPAFSMQCLSIYFLSFSFLKWGLYPVRNPQPPSHYHNLQRHAPQGLLWRPQIQETGRFRPHGLGACGTTRPLRRGSHVLDAQILSACSSTVFQSGAAWCIPFLLVLMWTNPWESEIKVLIPTLLQYLKPPSTAWNRFDLGLWTPVDSLGLWA